MASQTSAPRNIRSAFRRLLERWRDDHEILMNTTIQDDRSLGDLGITRTIYMRANRNMTIPPDRTSGGNAPWFG